MTSETQAKDKSFSQPVESFVRVYRRTKCSNSRVSTSLDNPDDKKHNRCQEVARLDLPLLDRETQLTGMTTPRNISIEETVTPRSQRDPNTVQASFEALDQSLLKSLPTEVNSKGVVPIDIATLPADGTSSLELLSELLTIEKVSELQAVWAYTPNVIEPSFVLGCILYCLPEQTYWHRPQDAARAVSHTVPRSSPKVLQHSMTQSTTSSHRHKSQRTWHLPRPREKTLTQLCVVAINLCNMQKPVLGAGGME